MNRRHLTRSQAGLLRTFLEQITPVRYTPSEQQLAQRLHELEELGLHDEPEFEGISSPVRQYALNSLLADAGYFDPPPAPFITFHPGLLHQAKPLARRYGLQPMTPEGSMMLDKEAASS